MPQIPVVPGGQRIEPSSPVAIASSENARMTGEQLAAVGKEVFNLGNALDATARKAKDNAARLNVARAAGLFKLEALRTKAQFDGAAINTQDSPDGVDGIDRYAEQLSVKMQEIGSGLGSDEERKMFEASVSDDVVSYATQVLAGDMEKRTKTIPLLMQDNLNTKGALARLDPRKVNELALEWDIEVQQNEYITDAQKPFESARGKRELAKSVLMGHIDGGNGGNAKSWNEARAFLAGDAATLFTNDEQEKLKDNISSAENSYWSRSVQREDYKRRADERKYKEDLRNQMAIDMQALKAAGNNDIKRNAVISAASINPIYDGDPRALEKLTSVTVFKEEGDDAYQLKFMDNIMRTKNYEEGLNQLQRDSNVRGGVSNDRAIKLQQAIRAIQEHNRTNPGLTKAFNEAVNELETSGSSSMIIDPSTGLYKPEVDAVTARARTEFSMWWANALVKGNVTTGDINWKLNSLYDKLGRTRPRIIPGVQEGKMRTSEGITETLNTIEEKIQRGEYKTPEQKKKLQQQLSEIAKARAEILRKESAQIRSNGKSTNPGRNFDDQ